MIGLLLRHFASSARKIYQAVPDTYEASVKNSSGHIYVGSMWTFNMKQLLVFAQDEVERRRLHDPSVQVTPEELILRARNFQSLEYKIQKEEEVVKSVEKGEEESSFTITAPNCSANVEGAAKYIEKGEKEEVSPRTTASSSSVNVEEAESMEKGEEEEASQNYCSQQFC